VFFKQAVDPAFDLTERNTPFEVVNDNRFFEVGIVEAHINNIPNIQTE